MSDSTIHNIADCVVIGGGIIGCAIAYYMAKDNRCNVTVCEQNTVLSGNTALAAGLLTRPREKEPLIPLVLETYRSVEMLQDELGEDILLHRSGSLHVASSEKVLHSIDLLEGICRTSGFRYDITDGHTVEQTIPWISGRDIRKALFVHDDAYTDPAVLGNSYAAAAKNRGAVILQSCRAEQVDISINGEILGVRTSRGYINTPVVVDSAGVWSVMIAHLCGISIPAAPVRSNYWISAPCEIVKRDDPFVIIPDSAAYARPDMRSILFGMRGTGEKYIGPAHLPDRMTGYPLDTLDEQWDMLISGMVSLRGFIPVLDNLPVAGYYSGLSAYTPDGMFVISSFDVKGFYAVTGFCGAGIAAAGGAGRIAAELVQGKNTFCSISEFRADRFGMINPLDESFMKRCAASRSGKISG